MVGYVSSIGPNAVGQVGVAGFRGDGGADLAQLTAALFEPILADLWALAEMVAVRFGGASVMAAEMDAMRPGFESMLRRHADLMEGCGFLAAPGVLGDARLHESFWEVIDGVVLPHSLNFDAHSEEFYDYSTKDFFRIPADTGEFCLVGPYVDYLGTNHYIVTMTVPVLAAPGFVGTVGVDIPLELLQQRLLDDLPDREMSLALVTNKGRVVLSTVAEVEAGAILREPALAAWFAASTREHVATESIEIWPCAELPWAVVTVE